MSVCLNTINTKLSISQDLSKSQMKKKKKRKEKVMLMLTGSCLKQT